MSIPRVFSRAGCLIYRTGNFLNRAPVINGNGNITRFISVTRSCLAERLYTDKHEWIQLDGKIGIVGISQYAQEALGDVVFAQLPDVNIKVTPQSECGTLESVKAASELFSPVSGRILEKNSAVEDTPSLINSSCYEKGWLFKIELADESELKVLMSEEQYANFLKTTQH